MSLLTEHSATVVNGENFPSIEANATAYGGEFNAFTFGALGDGYTNDTLAIQAAINAAAEVVETYIVNKIVFVAAYVSLLPGNFVVDTITLRTGVELRGSGMSNTVLVHTGGAANVLEAPTTTVKFNIRVTDLTIVGDNSTTLAGIYMQGCVLVCEITRVMVRNCQDGIFMDDSWAYSITDSFITSSYRYNIHIANATASMVRNCRLDNPGEHNIFIGTAAVNVGQTFTIADCKIQSSTKAGIYIEDTGCICLINNFFEQNNEENASWGDIHVAATATNLEQLTVIGGFHTPGSSGATTSRGLYAAEGRHVLVMGMFLRGGGYTRGVECTAAVGNATILNSYFQSAALDVLLDPATRSEYQRSGSKFIGGAGSSGVFNTFDMQSVTGISTGGMVAIGTFNSVPTLQGAGSGTSFRLALNPNAGQTDVSVNSTGNGVVRLGGIITILRNVTGDTTLNADNTTVCISANAIVLLTNIVITMGRCLFISQIATGLTVTINTGNAATHIFVAGVDMTSTYALPSGGGLSLMSNGTHWVAF